MAKAPERSKIAPFRACLASGSVLAAAAGWLIGASRPVAGGALALIAGGLIVAGSRRSRETVDLILESLADRIWDVAVLGSMIWTYRSSNRGLAAAALCAFALSSLAVYERARGDALGYPIEDPIPTRAVRFIAVGIGLAAGVASLGTWIAAGWCALTVGVRASQVAKGERA
jgi:hypothetical protein